MTSQRSITAPGLPGWAPTSAPWAVMCRRSTTMLACVACDSHRDVRTIDELGHAGFCAECRDGAGVTSDDELGGEG